MDASLTIIALFAWKYTLSTDTCVGYCVIIIILIAWLIYLCICAYLA